MSDLVRFSVAIPEDLLMAFDTLVAKRGVAKNRSEVIRDLIRDALVDEQWDTPGQEIVGTLTLVFDVASGDLQQVLEETKYSFRDEIVATTRVYLDNHNCLEVMVLKGESDKVAAIANLMLGTKGVKHGHLTTTTTGKFV